MKTTNKKAAALVILVFAGAAGIASSAKPEGSIRSESIVADLAPNAHAASTAAVPTPLPVYEEAITRASTVVNRAGSTPEYSEMVTRSATVVNRAGTIPQYAEMMTRAATVVNRAGTIPQYAEMTARAFTVCNEPAGGDECRDRTCIDDSQCIFCNSETCMANLCVGEGDPCPPGLVCDEVNRRCVTCRTDDHCLFCNGETCVGDVCEAGPDPCPGLACDEENKRCIECGDPDSGSCFDPHGTPSCDKKECCEAVCEQLPHCCAEPWDTTCVQAALTLPECDCVIEKDHFEFSVGQLELILPGGAVESIPVTGPALAFVFFEGPNEGDADDDDGNNLDEVRMEMVSLSLSGTSPSLGAITVDLNPASPSLGLIEEKEDTLTDRLDLPPFAPTGTASSYFDMFFRVHVDGMTFHTIIPKRMSSQISHKPPGPGAVYESPQIIELYDENGQPTGYFLGATRHQPNPLVSTFPPHCAIDARQPHPVGPNENQECGLPKFGWDGLTMQFNVDPTILNLQPSDFSVVMVPPGEPPLITNVVPGAASQTAQVWFDRPIEPGHWTCVVYTATGRRWCLGYLPGDSSQDRLSATSDIGALINSINLVPGLILPPYATDINRSDVTTGVDILREIDLLNGAGCFDVWITRTLPDCPPSYPEPPD